MPSGLRGIKGPGHQRPLMAEHCLGNLRSAHPQRGAGSVLSTNTSTSDRCRGRASDSFDAVLNTVSRA